MARAIVTFGFLLAIISSCGSNANQYASNGDRLFANGKYREAAEMYGKALSLDARFATAHYGRGRCLQSLGDYPDAEGAFRRALELLPPNSAERQDTKVQLAYVLVHSWNDGALDEVEKVAVELCKRDPNSFDGRRLLGELALVRAHKRASNLRLCEFYVDDAINEYRIATKVRPKDALVTLELARSLAIKGLPAESEQVYWAATRLDKTDPQTYAELYRLFLAQGKLPEAEQVLRDAIFNVPAHQGFALMLAAQTLATNPAMALPAIEQLKVKQLGLPAANLIAGDFYVRAGQLDRAKQEYRRSISAKQYERACRVRLIEIATFQKNDADLKQLLQETLKADSTNATVIVADAVLKLKANDIDAAERELRTVLDVVPEGPIARYHLAKIQARQEQFTDAILTLQTALQRKPGFIQGRLLLAQLQFASEDYVNAQKSAQEVLTSQSDNADARIVFDAAKKAADRGIGALDPDTRGAVTSAMVSDGSGVSTDSKVTGGASIQQPVELKDSVCDAAVAAFSKLRAKDYERFDLAAAVPGVWSTAALATYLGD